MRFELTMVIVAIMAIYANGSCTNPRTYDCTHSWNGADIAGVVIGYTITVGLVVYTLIRLFWEEANRRIEYSKKLNDAEREAEKYDITYEKIMQQERERREREQEEIFGK